MLRNFASVRNISYITRYLFRRNHVERKLPHKRDRIKDASIPPPTHTHPKKKKKSADQHGGSRRQVVPEVTGAVEPLAVLPLEVVLEACAVHRHGAYCHCFLCALITSNGFIRSSPSFSVHGVWCLLLERQGYQAKGMYVPE